MLGSYFRTALRALKRRPGFAAINILGLSVGMACCLLIGLYVQNELSYDRFHDNADRLYRVVQRTDDGGSTAIGDAIVPILQEDVPGIERVVRVMPTTVTLMVEQDGAAPEPFEVEDFVYADTSLFQAFNFPLQQGDPETVLDAPAQVVLSESMAQRLFGTTDVVGNTLSRENNRTFTVAGVMDDLPANSHLQFEMAASIGTFYTDRGRASDAIYGSFWFPSAWTYVQVAPDADPEALSAQVDATVNENRRPEVAEAYTEGLQPITSIHLHPTLGGGASGGTITRIYVFGAVALFVLLIACVNFMNLSTARAAERSREVGVRKAIGAQQTQLVRQFMGEALLLSLFAGVIALALAGVLRPALEALVGTTLAVGVLSNPWLWAGFAVVVLVTGLGAGSYPALFLTRYNPVDVLRASGGTTGGGGQRLRQGLVVLQFAVSVTLIVAATVAYQQLTYMQDARLGFDSEALVTIEADGDYSRLKSEMERRSEIVQVAATSARPGIDAGGGYRYEVNGEAPTNEEERLDMQFVDFGFFETMGVDVIAGRPFLEDRLSDRGEPQNDRRHFATFYRERAIVVNRSFVKKMGWTPQEALGQQVRGYTIEGGTYYADHQGEIIGVVEDYHATSLREKIPPVAYFPVVVPVLGDDGETQAGYGYYALSTILAKVAPGNAANAMSAIQTVWNEVVPDSQLEATFVDETLNRLYETERRTGQIIAVFSLIAVVIACLGLFGLATYTTQQRRKEIGIRKAVGASVPSIVQLLSADFLRLVVVAVLLGAPLAYMLMQRWLSDFAYRVDLGLWPFVAAAVAAVAIALGTVSTQALRASRINPADTLRSE